MKKKVILIHGWDGSPTREWFPWTKNELEKRGFKAIVPTLPDAEHPKLEPWLDAIEKESGVVDENTIFVAHSLGVITVIQFLAKRVPESTKIAGAIFVAGFSGRIFEPSIAEFYDPNLNISKVAEKIYKKFVFYSDDDDLVTPEKAHKFSNDIDAQEVFLPGRGHFSEDEKVFELPELLETIEKI